MDRANERRQEIEAAVADVREIERREGVTRESLERRLAGTGLSIRAWFTDPEGLFADVLLDRG